MKPIWIHRRPRLTHALSLYFTVAMIATIACDAAPSSAALEDAASMSLSVLNSAGQPLAGASIRLEGPNPLTVMTASDGVASLKLQDVAQNWRVRVEKEGYVPRGIIKTGRSDAALPTQYIVKLEPQVALGGTIRDEDAKPVSGVAVAFASFWMARANPSSLADFQDLRDVVAISDAQGHWFFQGAPATLAEVQITLSHPDYLIASTNTGLQHPSAAALHDFSSVFVIKPASQQTAWLETFSKTAASKAFLADSQKSQQSMRSFTFDISDDGAFRIEDVPPGQYTLNILVPASAGAGDARRSMLIGLQKVVIEPITGGRTDQPLELPPLQLSVQQVELQQTPPSS